MSESQDKPKVGLFKTIKSLFQGTSAYTLRESLEEVIDEHVSDEPGTELGDDQRQMLFNILEYGSVRVEDVMVPRADMVAVDGQTPIPELIKLISEAAHSRLPVYRETLDDVRGMVHVKDVLADLAQKETASEEPTSSLQRPVLFVPPSMRIIDLLARMRASRTHMAIVIDEYGGTDGLITIEDIVEQIIGDIEDEHDEGDEPALLRLSDQLFVADARLQVDELEEVLGVELLDDDQDEGVDTIGGLVFTMAGRIPEIGEMFEHENGFAFEVLDADLRRINKIRIHGQAPDADGAGEGDD